MARRVAGAAKHHRPGYVADAAPQLAVDEVAQAPGGDARRHERRGEIHHLQVRHVVAPRREGHRRHHAEQPAVEGHPALPQGEDLERVREVVVRLVEEHVAQPPAEDHAEHDEEKDVVELGARHGDDPLLDAAHAEPPSGGEADEVHQAVPADRERSDLECDGIDIGMDEHARLSPGGAPGR
jgi:hypothetical protein